VSAIRLQLESDPPGGRKSADLCDLPVSYLAMI